MGLSEKEANSICDKHNEELEKAAAPELLEALALLYELCNNGQAPGNDDLDKAFSAIQKATS